MAIHLVKLPSKKRDLLLRVAKGHFATSHSHINYFIDVTMQKTRLSEAKAVAQELVRHYASTTVVDTVLCLDGTEVIGACLANELTRGGYMNMNAHQTIYVVTPEHTSGSQLLFRENTAPMITNKHVLILAASVTTGFTAQAAVEAVDYYGGIVAGITAIFATVDECAGHPVTSIFDPATLGDYQSFDSRDCPWCKAGQKIDALVNSYGYSSL
ncbi:MAG TPA: phosphoribosyltransferase [Candidatus Gemmiger avicola]|uniref:Phosphoribosyltransferase n=1 Tax=Candidatus Gemmiger avicola TaxID=2838605 RepID=A0A9D2S367_9FIRM|nr:phosphoribosyltransferase [Candidatus Gemmiger avicola]